MKRSGRLFFIDARDRKTDVDQNEIARAGVGSKSKAYRLVHAAEIDASGAERRIGACNGQKSSWHSQTHILAVPCCKSIANPRIAIKTGNVE